MRPQAPEPAKPPPNLQSPWVWLRSISHQPFVYKKMLRDADAEARPGDVVNVYERGGQLVGRGLYNPRSQIVVRMLAQPDVPIDEAFWRQRFEQAVALRAQLRLDEITDAYRLVHAEGDGLSGLIVERYADYLVFEVFSLGMFQRWPELADIVGNVLGAPTRLDRPDTAGQSWRTVVRADTRIAQIEGFRVPEPTRFAGKPPARTTIREHGIRHWVNLETGHKTGFFCDQRDNRRRFANFCRDAHVLDLCCYTGAFSLCATLIGGAKAVTAVDLDENAIAVAKENANLNQTRIDFVYADAFTFLRQMIQNGRQFDAVVLDPPKLATYRGECEDALRKYNDFNALAMQVVRPGGVLLTCSCSGLISRPAFHDAVFRAATRVGRSVQVLDETGAAPDHPVMMNCPASAYLKTLWLRVL